MINPLYLCPRFFFRVYPSQKKKREEKKNKNAFGESSKSFK